MNESIAQINLNKINQVNNGPTKVCNYKWMHFEQQIIKIMATDAWQ